MLRPSENLTGESTERDTWIHAAHKNCTYILTCASIDSKLNTKPPHSEAERPPSFIHTAVDFKVGLGLPAISYTACKRVCHT